MLCRGRHSLEEHFPHHNWLIVIGLLLFIGYTGHIMFAPSIYQFITTPRSPPDDLINDENFEHFWPGLGGTERDYAWVLISFSIFETGLIPPVTIMLGTLPYTVSLLTMMALYGASGIVYACATEVWMVIVARCLMGSGALFTSAVIYTYIGEIGTTMDEIRKKHGKAPRKHALYIMATFFSSGANALLLAINASIVRIPSVNPYRWPGWFQAGLALFSTITVLLFFVEPRPWSCNKKYTAKCSCMSGLKLSMKLRSKTKLQVMIHLFILASSYVIGQVLSVVYMLIAPVLSDKFGFSVANTSLYFVALTIPYFVSSFVQLLVTLLKVGCALISDWQAVHGDTCPSFHAGNSSTLNITMVFSDTNVTQLLVENCEAQSSSNHQCFWNPQSRVTGDYCNTCLSTCLSHQTSLNFYQFNLGVFLVAMGSLVGFIFINAVNSDVTSTKKQGSATTLLVGLGALGRAITPFRFVESYDSTGRHTYLPMSITIGCLLILLFSLVALYKDLAPRTTNIGMTMSCAASTRKDLTSDTEKQSVSQKISEVTVHRLTCVDTC